MRFSPVVKLRRCLPLIAALALAVSLFVPVSPASAAYQDGSTSTTASSPVTHGTVLNLAGDSPDERLELRYTQTTQQKPVYAWLPIESWTPITNRAVIPKGVCFERNAAGTCLRSGADMKTYLHFLSTLSGIPEAGYLNAVAPGDLLPTNLLVKTALAGNLQRGETISDWLCLYPIDQTAANKEITKYAYATSTSPPDPVTGQSRTEVHPTVTYCHAGAPASYVDISCVQSINLYWDPYSKCSNPNSLQFGLRSVVRKSPAGAALGHTAPQVSVGRGVPSLIPNVCPSWVAAGAYYWLMCVTYGPSPQHVLDPGLVNWAMVSPGMSYDECKTTWKLGCGFDSGAHGVLSNNPPTPPGFYPLTTPRYDPADPYATGRCKTNAAGQYVNPQTPPCAPSRVGWPELRSFDEQWYFGFDNNSTMVNGALGGNASRNWTQCPATAVNSLGETYTPKWGGVAKPNWCYLQDTSTGKPGGSPVTEPVLTRSVALKCFSSNNTGGATLVAPVTLPDASVSSMALTISTTGSKSTVSVLTNSQPRASAVIDPKKCNNPPLRPS